MSCTSSGIMESKPAIFLMSWATWLFAVTVAVLYLVISRILVWYRLRHIKGPFWAAFSKWWMMRKTMGGQMHLELARVCDQYGPLARIGPDYLVTSDPNVLRRLWAVRSPYVRSDWYDAMRLDPSKDNVLSERNDAKHTELRSKLATGYTGKENDQLERCIDKQVFNLVKLIETKYISTGLEFRPFEFARKVQFFTLDVITAIAFGDPFGYLTKDEDIHEYIKTTEETLPAIIMVGVFPWLSKVLQSPFMRIFLPSDKDALGLGKVMGIAKEVVASRYDPEKETQQDMLGSFIRHGITQAEAESECLVSILAGSDTTATAIRMTMFHIVTSPKVYSKLQSEIDAAADNQHLSSPITDAEAKTLPYLQACIKEGLRIWPPVTGLISKEAPEGGDFIHKQFIPAGTKVAYCAWGVFRDRTIWGDDANSYRPERWLDADEERLKIMESTAEILFQPGRWQCLGKSIALMELNKVFVELLRRFDFSLINPEDPLSTYNVGIFIQSKMFFRVYKRMK